MNTRRALAYKEDQGMYWPQPYSIPGIQAVFARATDSPCDWSPSDEGFHTVDGLRKVTRRQSCCRLSCLVARRQRGLTGDSTTTQLSDRRLEAKSSTRNSLFVYFGYFPFFGVFCHIFFFSTGYSIVSFSFSKEFIDILK